MLKVLIGCEESGTVRDAFAALGHDAWSCDILPSRAPGKHLQCDVRDVLGMGWDLAVFHTPCTFLSNSGVRWLYKDGKKANGPDPDRWESMRRDAELFRTCWSAPIPMIAMENPRPHPYAMEIMGARSQIIQPFQFGHGEQKETWLWLKNLPPLLPTDEVLGREQRVWKMAPGPNRQRDRSVTYPGIARAMAEQWGKVERVSHGGSLYCRTGPARPFGGRNVRR